MEHTEKWGKDVDEAVRLALDEMGLTEDQVMVTVLEESSKGFLGLGAKLAKVRVEKIGDESEPTKKEKKKNKKSSETSYGARDLRKKDKKPQGQNGQKRDNYKKDDYKKSDTFVEIKDKPNLSKKPDDLVEDENNEAAEFLKGIVKKMNIEIDMKTSKNDECVYIEISGKDARTVIGKRGQTLDSLQYLVNLVTNKEREEYLRVIIDVEGYRSRREKTLEKLAAKLASKVLKTGKSVKLEPMNPYERKVIHAALQTIDGVTTRSEGEEPYRRVVVEKK